METKQCAGCSKDFTVEKADIDFYEKLGVPTPDKCPNCRLKMRLAFWPFGKFHVRNCDLSGERIISIFPPKAKFPVYKTSNWYSDSWEVPALDYDPDAKFLDQVAKLQSLTPHPHQSGAKNTDCDSSDDAWECKKCYLCRSMANCENVSYGYRMLHCRDSQELTYCFDTEESYDCTLCSKISHIKYALNVRDSFDSVFLYDCRNVSNCFMCWNLRNKEYNIMNVQYSKEDYFKTIAQYDLGSSAQVENLKTEFNKLLQTQAVHRINNNIKTINSTGNFLTENKGCRQCFFLETSEDCSHLFRGNTNKDCIDSIGLLKCELFYDSVQMGEGYNVKHSMFCTNCRDSEYLDFCIDCVDCFGCVSLRKKQYYILNKQYNKEDYEKLVAEIKEKMKKDGAGDHFFPIKMAQTGYNLSLAQTYFPETEEGVKKFGGEWEELEKTESKGRETIPFPDNTKDVTDDVVTKALVCEATGRLFSINKDDLEFYRKNNIPIPHLYCDERTMRRLRLMPFATSTKANCTFCNKEMVSYFPPEWGYERIACEDCYKREIA